MNVKGYRMKCLPVICIKLKSFVFPTHCTNVHNMLPRQRLLLTLHILWQSMWVEKPQKLPVQQQLHLEMHCRSADVYIENEIYSCKWTGGVFIFSATLRTEMSGPNEFLETILYPWFLSYTHTHNLLGRKVGSKQHPHCSSRYCPALANSPLSWA